MPPWQNSLTWTLGLRVVQVAGSHLEVPLPVPLTPGGIEAGMAFLMCYSQQLLWHHLICCDGWYASPIFRSMEKDSFNRFVHSMAKGHHLQLWGHPPLFCNFKWFNIK